MEKAIRRCMVAVLLIHFTANAQRPTRIPVTSWTHDVTPTSRNRTTESIKVSPETAHRHTYKHTSGRVEPAKPGNVFNIQRLRPNHEDKENNIENRPKAPHRYDHDLRIHTGNERKPLRAVKVFAVGKISEDNSFRKGFQVFKRSDMYDPITTHQRRTIRYMTPNELMRTSSVFTPEKLKKIEQIKEDISALGNYEDYSDVGREQDSHDEESERIEREGDMMMMERRLEDLDESEPLLENIEEPIGATRKEHIRLQRSVKEDVFEDAVGMINSLPLIDIDTMIGQADESYISTQKPGQESVSNEEQDLIKEGEFRTVITFEEKVGTNPDGVSEATTPDGYTDSLTRAYDSSKSDPTTPVVNYEITTNKNGNMLQQSEKKVAIQENSTEISTEQYLKSESENRNEDLRREESSIEAIVPETTTTLLRMELESSSTKENISGSIEVTTVQENLSNQLRTETTEAIEQPETKETLKELSTTTEDQPTSTENVKEVPNTTESTKEVKYESTKSIQELAETTETARELSITTEISMRKSVSFSVSVSEKKGGINEAKKIQLDNNETTESLKYLTEMSTNHQATEANTIDIPTSTETIDSRRNVNDVTQTTDQTTENTVEGTELRQEEPLTKELSDGSQMKSTENLQTTTTSTEGDLIDSTTMRTTVISVLENTTNSKPETLKSSESTKEESTNKDSSSQDKDLVETTSSTIPITSTTEVVYEGSKMETENESTTTQNIFPSSQNDTIEITTNETINLADASEAVNATKDTKGQEEAKFESEKQIGNSSSIENPITNVIGQNETTLETETLNSDNMKSGEGAARLQSESQSLDKSSDYVTRIITLNNTNIDSQNKLEDVKTQTNENQKNKNIIKFKLRPRPTTQRPKYRRPSNEPQTVSIEEGKPSADAKIEKDETKTHANMINSRRIIMDNMNAKIVQGEVQKVLLNDKHRFSARIRNKLDQQKEEQSELLKEKFGIKPVLGLKTKPKNNTDNDSEEELEAATNEMTEGINQGITNTNENGTMSSAGDTNEENGELSSEPESNANMENNQDNGMSLKERLVQLRQEKIKSRYIKTVQNHRNNEKIKMSKSDEIKNRINAMIDRQNTDENLANSKFKFTNFQRLSENDGGRIKYTPIRTVKTNIKIPIDRLYADDSNMEHADRVYTKKFKSRYSETENDNEDSEDQRSTTSRSIRRKATTQSLYNKLLAEKKPVSRSTFRPSSAKRTTEKPLLERLTDEKPLTDDENPEIEPEVDSEPETHPTSTEQDSAINFTPKEMHQPITIIRNIPNRPIEREPFNPKSSPNSISQTKLQKPTITILPKRLSRLNKIPSTGTHQEIRSRPETQSVAEHENLDPSDPEERDVEPDSNVPSERTESPLPLAVNEEDTRLQDIKQENIRLRDMQHHQTNHTQGSTNLKVQDERPKHIRTSEGTSDVRPTPNTIKRSKYQRHFTGQNINPRLLALTQMRRSSL